MKFMLSHEEREEIRQVFHSMIDRHINEMFPMESTEQTYTLDELHEILPELVDLKSKLTGTDRVMKRKHDTALANLYADPAEVRNMNIKEMQKLEEKFGIKRQKPTPRTMQVTEVGNVTIKTPVEAEQVKPIFHTVSGGKVTFTIVDEEDTRDTND